MRIEERFAANLTRHRRAADLSQEKLSVMAGLHRTEISQLERALRMPRLDTIVKLAASLEVSMDELTEGMSWRPGSVRSGQFQDRRGGLIPG
jgi:transcriptional regulator with XRE-family HTH domain